VSSVLFLIGKTLGKYQVLEHIGHGGMSEVYKGQHEQLDRMVAVKVLHPFLANEEGFVIRFKREASIVAKLRHPNIMQVFDFDYNEELDIYYMVMEFIDGPTLKDRLNNEALPQEEAVRIGALIADALDYAHRRGMVHRDVKPANIMFMPDGQPVLTDFGIAKMLTLSGLTASGAMVGTPAYMAPEVGMGRPGSAAADIYSLGIVLYQMVTGRLPFESESPMGMVMQHINEAPPPLEQFVPALLPALDAVIMKALAKQPEERFASAAEMAAALRQIIGMEAFVGAPVVSPPLAASPSPVTPPTLPPTSGAVTRPARQVDEDEDDRLLRTWPVLGDSKPAVRTPTLFPTSKAKAAAEQEIPAVMPRRRSPLLRLARTLVVLLLIIVAGAVAWFGIRGNIPPVVQHLLTLAAAVRQPSAALVTTESPVLTATPTSEAEITATTLATATPKVVGNTATPTVPLTATPSPASQRPISETCTPRIRLNQVRVEPDDVVSPGAMFSAYVSLRNAGDCAWPTGLQFAFTSGEQMASLTAIPVQPIATGENIQVILPLQAPLETGVYTASWQVRQVAGPVLGSAIPIRIEVRVAGTPTPTPKATRATATTTPTSSPPLVLVTPVLSTWREDAVSGVWSGTVVLQATGGVGNYRYYRQTIREDTWLPDGQLTIEGRRCQAAPVTVLVVSGQDEARWEGWIAYPAAENCR